MTLSHLRCTPLLGELKVHLHCIPLLLRAPDPPPPPPILETSSSPSNPPPCPRCSPSPTVAHPLQPPPLGLKPLPGNLRTPTSNHDFWNAICCLKPREASSHPLGSCRGNQTIIPLLTAAHQQLASVQTVFVAALALSPHRATKLSHKLTLL